ncbi:flagellar hook-associated protein FlgK [Methylobrevis pamukkalensis]|uniref:Flagellar hook-associated protein 1 n=1 Tax=Methylobrevis pamukkalensis TaxID=1439726 RepID=A0A1E3H355_9HYPH|nr:Flagellar hook-associated protein 1 [Methylobrevis pamukkalensis]
MSITSALRTSLSGLSVNQRELEVVANNIANASTVGYTRKTLETSANVSGGKTYGVSVTALNRELNVQVQKQWRTSVAASEYSGIRSDMMTRLDALYGEPGSESSMSAIFSAFTSSIEALATSPESTTTRTTAVAAAGNLATSINQLSDQIQSLRNEAESGIAQAVEEANALLQRIETLDKQIVAASAGSLSPVALMDQRDAAVDSLSRLMDVRVSEEANNKITISTIGGAQLYGAEAATLKFDQHGVIDAKSTWSADADERTVGTVTLVGNDGYSVDLFADGAIRSGSIAAYKSLRDDTLVEAQTQLDELASQMILALSNRTEAGTAVTSGAQAGFDLDTSALLEGNTMTLTFDDNGTARTFSFVATDGAATVDNDYTADPSDTVVGIDISGGAGSIATQIAAALGSSFTVSNPSGDTVRILDDGAADTIDITGFDASVTVTDEQSGDAAFALFVDGGASGGAYTGLIDGEDQRQGLAARLRVNSAVRADPALMVNYSATTAPSDSTRPAAILEALTNTNVTFSGEGTGIGSKSTPFVGTIDDYLAQIISTQAPRPARPRASPTASRSSPPTSPSATTIPARSTSTRRWRGSSNCRWPTRPTPA